MKAALTDQILIRKGKIWIAKRRTDHVAIFPTSAPKIFNAAGLIGLVAAVEDSAVIALEEVVALGVAALEEVALAVEAALADSEVAAAGSGADGNNLGLGFASNFPYNQKTQSTHLNKTYEKTIHTNKYRCCHGGIGADNSV